MADIPKEDKTFLHHLTHKARYAYDRAYGQCFDKGRPAEECHRAGMAAANAEK